VLLALGWFVVLTKSTTRGCGPRKMQHVTNAA